ncbi:MAG: serine protease [Acidimicrobiales bacterium]|jgi:hypothetical protein|nr:serine protease [Acidimicrobiales bacterium]
MTLVRRTAIIATMALGAYLLAPPSASQAATGAPIHPGVQTFTNGAQCTANFIFTGGTNTYIGQAAHCAGTGGNTETNGCTAGTLPEGTPVTVTGASKPGKMVYSSWVRMKAAGEKDTATCQYNDLALIQLDPADAANVDPSVPHWGGPTGVSTSGCAGTQVYSYGNSELRLGITQLSPKTGWCVTDDGGGWSHRVATVSPGIPGDSGSAFLDSSGKALGVLSTLEVLPVAGSNNIGDLGHELAWANAHGFSVALKPGTAAFNGNQLPIG